MEFVGQPGPFGACNLLGVPGLSTLDVDEDDDGEVVISIRPKSSPLPRRRSSATDEELEPEPPLSRSRRVSFADAKGLNLVQVKEFGTWDVPKLPVCDSSEGEGKDAEEYFLSPLTFSLPLSTEELFLKVREQKLELETIKLLPGTTILKGVIRVLNISFDKVVYVRTTLDSWSSHFDLLAEYIPGSSDGLTDCFSFKLTLVPPFGEQGARVDFCLRYETPVGTFWTNNNNKNYVLFCHQRMKERKEQIQKENVNKKSCLKTVSQNFSTAENISAMEASSQENYSTAVKRGEEVDKQISDGQSGTSEEDRQKLLMENRQNCSRRNRRKAARMARVRDLFARRNGGANDTGRDESPPETKQAAQEETPEEKHSDVQSCPEGSSKSEVSQLVSESLETRSEPLLDDTSPAQDYTSSGQPVKSESINLADSEEGESATDIPGNPLHSNDDPASAECQNIYKSVYKDEGSSQRQGTSYECTSDIAAEPADSVISAASSESLLSQTNNFTFGTVVAPLYRQVFGRVRSESQNTGDWGNPVRATLSAGDLTQSYPLTERRETSSTVPTYANSDNDNVQGNVIKAQELNQKCLNPTLNNPPTVEEETSLSATENGLLDHAESLHDPTEIHPDQRFTNSPEVSKTTSGDTAVHPHTANILNTDFLNPQIPTESLHLQGEAQEDNLTHDLQSQTTAETAQAQQLEQTFKQIKTNLDETLAQSETEEAMTSLETSFTSLQPSQSVSQRISDETDRQISSNGVSDCNYVDESNKDDDTGKTATISTTNGNSEEDKPLDALHDLVPNHIKISATKEAENSYVSCSQNGEEKDVTTPHVSLETQEETNNVEEGNKAVNNSHKDETKHSAEIKVIGEEAESMSQAMIRSYHIHGDMLMELKDEDTLKDEENTEHHEMEAAASKQEDFCLADTSEAKNWEMMVEEEEINILTDEDQSKAISLKAEDIEAEEKDQGEQLEDTGTETVSEDRETTETEKEKTEDEMVGEITAATQKENNVEDTDVLENKQRIGEEEIVEIVAGKGGKELKYFQAKTAGEEELTEIEVEKRQEQEDVELDKEKHFAEIQEVSTERTNVQEEEEEMEGEEEKEIDLINVDRAGVEWEDQVKPWEENVEEENPDYKEEILVNDTGDSEIVDAESESMTIEDSKNEEGFEERLDITQHKGEDGLSALVNNVQDKRVIDKDDTGEGQKAHIPTEMHLYKEEAFQSNENVTHDLPKAQRDENESPAAEGGSCIFTDEPENEQTGYDSASAESDSDDEMELYMHCLRAVHTGAQSHKDRNKDTGFSAGKRHSINRGKLLSTPMPSISESLDEEQHPLLDNHEDTADIQPTAATQQKSINRNVSWWREAFSCSNISKTLLYATLLVVFVVVACHCDFLAFFGLYLMSVIWLYYQGERQPVKSNKE